MKKKIFRVYESYNPDLVRLVWQTVRADEKSSGLGRGLYCDRVQNTILREMSDDLEIRNEYDDIIEIDPGDCTPMRLWKYIQRPPKCRKSKIHDLVHLYCQIAFKDRSFVDTQRKFVEDKARDFVFELMDWFPKFDLQKADSIAKMFEGAVCMESAPRIRVGNFIHVPRSFGVLFGHSQLYRPTCSDSGRELMKYFKYPNGKEHLKLLGLDCGEPTFIQPSIHSTKSIRRLTHYIVFRPGFHGSRDYRREEPDRSVFFGDDDYSCVVLIFDKYDEERSFRGPTIMNLRFNEYSMEIVNAADRYYPETYEYRPINESVDYTLTSPVKSAEEDNWHIFWRKLPDRMKECRRIFDIYGWSVR